MSKFYAYIRVSTAKQEKGVSLEEQKGAIQRFADRQGLQVTEWFEEVLTAAKKGRPLFSRMINGLKVGHADGVIMHKIDRSARNLRDWLELADLIDAGQATVHFVNENIDLRSRGGRLSADIQAVIAADYIRNLREETRKGIYGRLKQGLYPCCAPPGYKNTGEGGKLKEIDKVRAPFVRQAFKLYASGRYTLDTLLVELNQMGFRNGKKRPMLRSSLALMLNNPFYAGIIRVRTTGETFQGKHEPLITMSLFKRVQDRLAPPRGVPFRRIRPVSVAAPALRLTSTGCRKFARTCTGKPSVRAPNQLTRYSASASPPNDHTHWLFVLTDATGVARPLTTRSRRTA